MMDAHEDRARARKAAAIVTVLREHDATAETAARLSADGRLTAATLAGQREPSERTWQAVVGMLQGVERSEAVSDPWEGLPVRQEGI